MFEFETRAVHAGRDPKIKEQSKTFSSICLNRNETCSDNATLRSLEKRISSLEHAEYALCYPSGTAAVTAMAQTLKGGDHVVLFDSVYHGTRTYFSICQELGKLEVDFADLRDANILRKYLKENTKMVWIETPCNPTMKLIDIKAISNILKENEGSIYLVVDNTFMSPYFQNPLLLGADVVLHSLTKYMNGFSDCMMGALATNEIAIYYKLKNIRENMGLAPSPLDCFLANRGLKTLHIRMQRHMENALTIAQYLESHPKVDKVFYPGLESHPQYEVAQKQCKGFSGMVSFCIKGGLDEAKAFVQDLKIFTLAVSLGSIESLIEIPYLMTAGCLTKEVKDEMEITENLIRISVGLEDVKDLIKDMEQAFERV